MPQGPPITISKIFLLFFVLVVTVMSQVENIPGTVVPNL